MTEIEYFTTYHPESVLDEVFVHYELVMVCNSYKLNQRWVLLPRPVL